MCVVCFYVYALAKACWLNIKKTKLPHILFVTSAGIFSNVTLLAGLQKWKPRSSRSSQFDSQLYPLGCSVPSLHWFVSPPWFEKKGLNNLPVIWSYASFLAFFSSIFAVFILHWLLFFAIPAFSGFGHFSFSSPSRIHILTCLGTVYPVLVAIFSGP